MTTIARPHCHIGLSRIASTAKTTRLTAISNKVTALSSQSVCRRKVWAAVCKRANFKIGRRQSFRHPVHSTHAGPALDAASPSAVSTA